MLLYNKKILIFGNFGYGMTDKFYVAAKCHVWFKGVNEHIF